MNWILGDIKKIHTSPGLLPPPSSDSPAPMIVPGSPRVPADSSFIPGMPSAPTPITPPIVPPTPMPSGPPLNGGSVPPVTPSAAAPEPTGPELTPVDLRGTPETPPTDQPQGKEPRQWRILRRQ